MIVTELTFKEAASEAKQIVRSLRVFEKLEEVLTAAANAEARVKGLEGKGEGLAESAGDWEEKVTAARAQYTSEQVIAGTELDRLREAANDAAGKAERDKEEALSQTRREIEEAQRAGSRKKRALVVECQELEEKCRTLEERLKRESADYDAFRAKVGMS